MSPTTNPRRQPGVLLHVTSLPGRFGIGDLGRTAYEFVDWLAAAGQSWWQILPLGPPAGLKPSAVPDLSGAWLATPYQSISMADRQGAQRGKEQS